MNPVHSIHPRQTLNGMDVPVEYEHRGMEGCVFSHVYAQYGPNTAFAKSPNNSVLGAF